MWQGVYYYLSYAVLFQFLPVGRPVIQRYYSRNAPFPKPKQSSLIRDDKLQGHRSSSGSPDYHWVKINIDWAFDIRVREWKIRSTVHNKAASILLPDDFPQTPAVYASDLHFDLLDLFLLPKNSTDYSWIRAREVPAPVPTFPPRGFLPISFMWMEPPEQDVTNHIWTPARRDGKKTRPQLWLDCVTPPAALVNTTPRLQLRWVWFSHYSECPLPAPTPVLSLFSGSTSCSVTIKRTQRQTL